MDDPQRQIAHNVRLAIEQLGPLSGLDDFGLNRPSVAWLEGFIEGQRTNPNIAQNPGGFVGVLGSFLGECIAANADGAWHHSGELGWCVRFSNGDVAFPFAKVQKQFDSGLAAGESILSFYDIAVGYVASGRMRDRDGGSEPTP
jgi:hypothetical protein